MQKLLLWFVLCPLFMFGQNVENVEATNYPIGANLAVVSGINADSCFSKIVSIIKSNGLDFDRIDRVNGIITTKVRMREDRYTFYYSLKVYLEKNELQVRVFSTDFYGDSASEVKMKQVTNTNNRFTKRSFSYLVYWADKIGAISNGKVVYRKE